MINLRDTKTKEVFMNKLWMILCILGINAYATVEDEVYITIGSDAVLSSQKSLNAPKALKQSSGITVMKVKKSEIESLSHLMHEKFNRCGGFIVHDSKAEAMEVLALEGIRQKAKNLPFADFTIDQEQKATKLVSMVKEFPIRDMILELSKFQNRYYKSQSGVDSQAYIKTKWEKLAAARNDVRVEYYKHSRWPQPSLIMTIEGTSKKDEIVIIGGHADSIAGWWGRERARAPGADDNASGIATITEVIRVMMESGYQPSRTIQFMAYAAEEVGLLGSKAIANEYKDQGKNVASVVQFDMTNHKGTEDLDIVFMTDYTNQAQNKFMGALIDKYVEGVSWGYSKCGYGCSDHASWHNAGFPASMPFESTMRDSNGHIHTKRDTIDVNGSGGTADHAEKFARLGVAYLVEMGK